MSQLIEMIRASFGDAIAAQASQLIESGEGQKLSFLQLVQKAERAHLAGSFGDLGQLQTNSHIEDLVENEQGDC